MEIAFEDVIKDLLWINNYLWVGCRNTTYQIDLDRGEIVVKLEIGGSLLWNKEQLYVIGRNGEVHQIRVRALALRHAAGMI